MPIPVEPEPTIVQRLALALQGKKTNFVSAWAFCGALYMWMNGLGEAEVAATLATVSTLAATLRAGIAKNGNAVLIVTAGLSMIFLVGCASLGVIDPATGTSPAQDIITAAGETAALFGPVIGAAVPVGLATVLSIIIALGRVQPE